MTRAWQFQPAMAVLLAGIALRVALGIATPPTITNDDHVSPVRIIAEQRRLPRADECWSCYQPPLFYVLAAGVYQAAGAVGDSYGGELFRTQWLRLKAMQWISILAGCATLWLCLPILRRTLNLSPWPEALALAVAAFLPRHIHMSAMLSNDAITYFMATAAVYAALRAYASAWSPAWVLAAGAAAGLAVLGKPNGLVCAATIVLGVSWFGSRHPRVVGQVEASRPTRKRDPRTSAAPHRPRWLPAVLVLAAALATGIWPTLRNFATYGRWHVDNYELFKTAVRDQPPGSLDAVSFFSFRAGSLWNDVWVHNRNVDSLPTQVYGRSWFDMGGTRNTLYVYEPWGEHWAAVMRAHPVRSRAQWEALLDYGQDATPPDFRAVGRASYLLGAPVTLALAIGLLVALRRFGRYFALTLLVLHFVAWLTVPVVQTIRLPNLSAMKGEFMLGFLSSLPVLAALAIPTRPLIARRIVIAVLSAAMIGLALANAAFAWIEYRYSFRYLENVAKARELAAQMPAPSIRL